MMTKNTIIAAILISFSSCFSPPNDGHDTKKKIFREAIAKDGAKLTVTVDEYQASMFQINGEKFKSCETLSFISNSCGEVFYSRIEADKNGNIPTIGYLPGVIGKSGGLCHIDFVRNQDSIHLEFPWGTEGLKSN